MSDVPAFFEAIRSGDLAKVDPFLRADAGLGSAVNAAGQSAILFALYNGHQTIAHALIARGTTPNFLEASALGNVERVSAMLAENPTLADTVTPDGFGALGLAAFFGREQVVALLARWCDPNAPSQNAMRVTALHAAVASRRPETALALARLLLAHGANPNVRQQGGWTPIHAAAMNGNMELVKLLLSNGADPTAANDEGKAPYDLAVGGGHDAVADLLAPST